MDLEQNRLPWSEQIWAKINADLAQALTQARRVRAPFEVVRVPESQQVTLADAIDLEDGLRFSEFDTLPIIELWSSFEISQTQVFNEGDGFFCLDRIIAAAHDLGHAEDVLLMDGDRSLKKLPSTIGYSQARNLWEGIGNYTYQGPPPPPGTPAPPNSGNHITITRNYSIKNPPGIELFNAVVDARDALRQANRFEPFALLVSTNLEGALQSTIPGTNSLNTPIERMRALVTAGIHSSSAIPTDSAVVIAVARPWVDIVQAMEPAVQFLSITDTGAYRLRLVERFALRVKDRRARCAIKLNPR